MQRQPLQRKNDATQLRSRAELIWQEAPRDACRRSFALSSAPTRLRFRGHRGQTLTNAARISRHSASNVTDRQLACELALRLCTATVAVKPLTSVWRKLSLRLWQAKSCCNGDAPPGYAVPRAPTTVVHHLYSMGVTSDGSTSNPYAPPHRTWHKMHLTWLGVAFRQTCPSCCAGHKPSLTYV